MSARMLMCVACAALLLQVVTSSSNAATTHKPPAPTPAPIPHYYIVDSDNKTCFILVSRIELELVSRNTTKNVSLDDTVSYVGHCKDGEATITFVHVFSHTDADHTLALSLTFNENATAKTWEGGYFNVDLDGEASEGSLSSLGARVGQQYSCGHNNFTITRNGTFEGQLLLLDTRVQAFGVVNGTLSSNVASCNPAKPSTNNTVPIAVGAALCGLVVIVLIAYLIGRSRSSRRGYQAV